MTTRLADQGVGVRVLMAVAGHKSIATTRRYIELNPIVMKAACLRLPVQPPIRPANAHSATHRRRLAMRADPGKARQSAG